MDRIEFNKCPYFKMFFLQFGDILAIETGLLICFRFIDLFSFYIFQLAIIPVFLFLLFAKYTKSVTKILLDIKKRQLCLRVNYFLIYNKSYDIQFIQLNIKIRNKWLLRYYYEIIEIKMNNKTIVVIPYKLSIWNETEFNKMKDIIEELTKKDLINAPNN